MPRKPREYAKSNIYHIMTRTFPGGKLFYDDKDKDVMLKILKKLIVELDFQVYAYCLMDTHTHFIFKTNKHSISDVMKKFNLRYGAYLRGTGKHSGPVFRGRYNSKAIENERYLIEVSKYIHKNPIDIKKYSKNPEKYKFSSLGIYLGLKKDEFGVCNEEFIMSLFSNRKSKAIESYYNEIFKYNIEKVKEVEFEVNNCEYRSEKVLHVKQMTVKEVEEYICSILSINKNIIKIKNLKGFTEYKAIYVLLLTRFLGKSRKEIASLFGNVTSATISKLCKLGVELICKEKYYENILYKFIKDNKIITEI